MKLTQFVANEDGGSRFEDVEIALDIAREGAGGYTLMTSEPFESYAISFVVLPADLDQDWHQAPTRQLVHVLSGSVEVETTDHEVRRFDAGAIFIAGDTSGQGHKTRVIAGPATVIFIPLPTAALR
jgi:quercetin dioxygenase-like cupin family protein